MATLVKELKLLLHDRTGLIILFAMPVLLVIIMTVIQNEAYKRMNESGIPVLVVDYDQDSLGYAITKAFSENALCDLTVDRGEQFKDIDAVRAAVLEESYLVALVIPENATKILEKDVRHLMDVYLFEDPAAIGKENAIRDIEFQIYTDPLARESFVLAMTNGLKLVVESVKTRVFFDVITRTMQKLVGSEAPVKVPDMDFMTFHEATALGKGDVLYNPSAVQHNVPAWAIFSIFFMIIPLAGSMILERESGIYVRMQTFPGSYLSIISGKFVAYVIIAILQFLVVVAIGTIVLPLIGIPKLQLGGHIAALSVLTLAVAFAAVGYGMLIGTAFDTVKQSGIFGGLSVIIMSALGGIWVPLNIMPPHVQNIAEISPLNWALKGYYELFIKGGDWFDVQLYVWRLLLFFVITVVASYTIHLARHRMY